MLDPEVVRHLMGRGRKGRLATLLLAIVLLVTLFDRVSRQVRAELALRH